MYRYIRKAWKAAVTLAFCTAFGASAEAMPQIMPLTEVAPGMVGEAYTVVDESGEIKNFRVDVIGVMGTSGKGDSPSIVAKASGAVIDSTGGVLQGMSGSPIYVNGRLVGALAAGFKEMTPYTFLIQPIEDMVRLWDLPDEKNKTKIKTIDLKKFAEDKAKKEKDDSADEKDGAEELAAEENKTEDLAVNDKADYEAAPGVTGDTEADVDIIDETANGSETSNELFFSGFDERSMSFFERNSHIKPVAKKYLASDIYGTELSTLYNATLSPGSPMGVVAVYGDFMIGATGTVTAVDNNKVVGFGHPFQHKGNVNYFLTDASVVGSIAGGISVGAKVANVMHIVGRVNQDRASGVSGLLGVFPSVVPMKVSVKDNTLGIRNDYGVRIAYDEEYLPLYTATVAYAGINKTSDDLSEGTAKLHFTIRTDAAENGKIERTNMFYNASDVGQISILELAQAMNIICSNKDKESDIIDVQVDVDMESNRKTASLVSAVPEKTTVKPGETVNIKTTIKPYRGEKQVLMIPYTVAKTQTEGTLNLDVRGGGFVPVSSVIGTDGNANAQETNTMEQLKALADSNMNNEIIIAPGASKTPLSEKEQKRILREAKEAAKNAPKEFSFEKKANEVPGQTRFTTDYIIDNVIHTSLKVEKN